MTEAEDAATAHITKSGTARVEVLHIGTELDHSEGYGGSDEGISTRVYSEEWIDIGDVVCGNGFVIGRYYLSY
jgi:hypothetical protein